MSCVGRCRCGGCVRSWTWSSERCVSAMSSSTAATWSLSSLLDNLSRSVTIITHSSVTFMLYWQGDQLPPQLPISYNFVRYTVKNSSITAKHFDFITRSSSEEAGTQFFRVLMRRSAVASRKQQLVVSSRLGRTEYQLLLVKVSWWGRNVKIRYKCLVVIDEFLTVLLYEPNEFISWNLLGIVM